MELQEILDMAITENGVYHGYVSRSLTCLPKDPKRQKYWSEVKDVLLSHFCLSYFQNDLKEIPWAEIFFALSKNISKRPICEVCGNKSIFLSFGEGYSKYCSTECVSKDSQLKERIKNTNLQKYGVPNAFCKESSKEKSRQNRKIIKEETGFWPGSFALRPKSQINKSINKAIKTKSEKFKAGNITERQIFKQEKILKEIPDGWSNPEFGYYSRLTSITHSCGTTQTNPRRAPNDLICYECQAPQKAQLQWVFEQKLKELFPDEEFIRNYRLPSKKQIDLFNQKRNLGIEINGLYWHSEAFKEQDENYHQQKYLEAKENGIKLITIWEDQIKEKSEIIFNRFKAIFLPEKINARQCEVVAIEKLEAKEFLQKYHLEGYISGNSLGLKYNNRLVMVATFGKTRFGKNREATELFRLATIGGVQVRGGLSKLIKHIHTQCNSELVSYASTDWGGVGYQSCGAEVLGLTKPGYFYFCKASGTRHHRLGFSKKAFKNTTGKEYDTTLSESENAKLAGFYRTFTGGSWSYRWA